MVASVSGTEIPVSRSCSLFETVSTVWRAHVVYCYTGQIARFRTESEG